jgi:hypothetical protein
MRPISGFKATRSTCGLFACTAVNLLNSTLVKVGLLLVHLATSILSTEYLRHLMHLMDTNGDFRVEFHGVNVPPQLHLGPGDKLVRCDVA